MEGEEGEEERVGKETEEDAEGVESESFGRGFGEGRGRVEPGEFLGTGSGRCLEGGGDLAGERGTGVGRESSASGAEPVKC
jgi:hypothetical protein